jgi:hypothetical protein
MIGCAIPPSSISPTFFFLIGGGAGSCINENDLKHVVFDDHFESKSIVESK